MLGASYEFLDDARQRLDSVRYYIEDVDIYGRVTRHGPLQVEGPSRVHQEVTVRGEKTQPSIEPFSYLDFSGKSSHKRSR